MGSIMKLWTVGCALMIASLVVPGALGSFTFTDADTSDTTKSTAAVVVTYWEDASLNGECTVTYTQKGTARAETDLFIYNYDTPGNAGAERGPFDKDGQLEKTEEFAAGDTEDLTAEGETENQSVPTDKSRAFVDVEARCSTQGIEFVEQSTGDTVTLVEGMALVVTCVSTPVGGQSCSMSVLG